jgi:hypothetical protein
MSRFFESSFYSIINIAKTLGELGNIEKYQVSVMTIHSGTSFWPFKLIGFRINGGFLIMKTQFNLFFLPEAVD